MTEAITMTLLFCMCGVAALIENKLQKRLNKTSTRQKISTLKDTKRAKKSRKQKITSRRKTLTLN